MKKVLRETQTLRMTGPITIHCTGIVSAQCIYREYCVNTVKHNIPVFDEMFSSSSSLQKCTKHTSINHILAV